MRSFLAAATAMACLVTTASADPWHLANSRLIDSNGTVPSLWGETIAYTDGQGGAVMYYDGLMRQFIYGPSSNGWEPANANGSIAWRNQAVAGDPGSNEILRWNGVFPVLPQNLSNSPGTIDADLDAAGNGDLIWSRSNASLQYYDASSGITSPLGISGVQPSVYVTDAGVATYAWQDPSTYIVYYFDGSTTHNLGPGDDDGAQPQVWDGAVTWIGEGVGMFFTESEIFYWKDGQTVRITDDDSVGGIADTGPVVWRDLVVWSRRVDGPFNPPQLYVWDGIESTKLTNTRGEFPSLHDGRVAWVDLDGMYLAALVGPADCNEDGKVDLGDYALFADCMDGPASPLGPGCACFDLDNSGTIDLSDFAGLQQRFFVP